jgi:transposase
MPRRLQLRALTDDEQADVRRLAHARTAAARVVQRAQLIVLLLDDATLAAGAAARMVGYQSAAAGWRIVKRFNTMGVASFDDARRAGRPRTHPEAVRSALISLAVQKPASLGLPFALWTLERLQTAFHERHGVHLSDSTIWMWLADEGLHWKRQQSWFRDAPHHDPAFVEKRGP